MIDIQTAAKRVLELTQQLNHYNNLYYDEAVSQISDKQYDLLINELSELEKAYPELQKPDSPTLRVGGNINKNFETVVHRRPMSSLDNTYSEQDLADFATRVEKGTTGEINYVAELKYDGVAVSLHYENGLFVMGLTRGDGSKGDNITDNLRTIRNIPLSVSGDKLPVRFEVRGEVFMPFDVFEDLNRQAEQTGTRVLANPRNGTAGALKLQDSAEVARRRLQCYVYALLTEPEEAPVDCHSDALTWLADHGFTVPESRQLCKNMAAVQQYINDWSKKRNELPLGTDGVVVKVNSYKQQQDLGYTSKFPRWAMAYKYAAEVGQTLLVDVEFSVGRTGAVTPIAHLEPVLLAGTTVKRASLYNADELDRLDLHLKDTVTVEKSGEIIPKVTSVVVEKRPDAAPKIMYPDLCPSCQTQLIQQEGEVVRYCPNEEGCEPQVVGRMAHFTGRNAMAIDGLGEKIIHKLFHTYTQNPQGESRRLLRTPADLYELKHEDLSSLEGLGEKSARNLIGSINASKNQPFSKVLFSLGIRMVGETVAEKLTQHFGTLQNLVAASQEDISNIHEIGDRIAESVKAYLANPRHLQEVERLQLAGLQMVAKKPEPVTLESESLSGKSLVVSGVFVKFSREAIQQKIIANGGKVVSSISKKTDYVVAGEKMGPSKAEKARKLKISVISEDELLALIG